MSIAFLAGLISIIAPFASDSYVPSLPAITKSLLSTDNQMQLTMSLYFLGASLAQLIYGPLSDRYGRRIMVLIGLSICVLGSFLCAISITGFMLIASRFLQGIGAGACNGLFRAIMRDKFSGAKLAQVGSYVGIVYPVTYAVAPILGGYVEILSGWRMSFIVSGIVVFLATIIVWKYLPETNHSLDKDAIQISKIMRNYLHLLTHSKFLGYTLISSLAFSGFVCYFTSAPFLLENKVGLSPAQFGWLSIFLALATIISQFINIKFVMKRGIKYMMFFGILLMMIGGVSMLIFALLGILNTWVMVIPITIFSLASGFVFSNAMAGAFESFGNMAGMAGAMYGFIQMIGSVVVSIFLSRLQEETQLPLSIIFTCLSLAALGIFYLIHKKKSEVLSKTAD
jgi:DHA1 family 2-module integral membrane pump EmrD-like MFS transporter